jgi:hypothetical protein
MMNDRRPADNHSVYNELPLQLKPPARPGKVVLTAKWHEFLKEKTSNLNNVSGVLRVLWRLKTVST